MLKNEEVIGGESTRGLCGISRTPFGKEGIEEDEERESEGVRFVDIGVVGVVGRSPSSKNTVDSVRAGSVKTDSDKLGSSVGGGVEPAENSSAGERSEAFASEFP